MTLPLVFHGDWTPHPPGVIHGEGISPSLLHLPPCLLTRTPARRPLTRSNTWRCPSRVYTAIAVGTTSWPSGPPPRWARPRPSLSPHSPWWQGCGWWTPEWVGPDRPRGGGGGTAPLRPEGRRDRSGGPGIRAPGFFDTNTRPGDHKGGRGRVRREGGEGGGPLGGAGDLHDVGDAAILRVEGHHPLDGAAPQGDRWE